MDSKTMFEESIKSENSLRSYTWYVQKYVDYWKLKDFDSILKFPKEEIQKNVETYVIHIKKRVNPNSVPSYLKPIKLFLEVNDVELKWKKITRLYSLRAFCVSSTASFTDLG